MVRGRTRNERSSEMRETSCPGAAGQRNPFRRTAQHTPALEFSPCSHTWYAHTCIRVQSVFTYIGIVPIRRTFFMHRSINGRVDHQCHCHTCESPYKASIRSRSISVSTHLSPISPPPSGDRDLTHSRALQESARPEMSTGLLANMYSLLKAALSGQKNARIPSALVRHRRRTHFTRTLRN